MSDGNSEKRVERFTPGKVAAVILRGITVASAGSHGYGGAGMGFALELANAGNSGMPDAWNVAPAAPRHRKPPHRRRLGFAGPARRARTVIINRPALADHRRAF